MKIKLIVLTGVAAVLAAVPLLAHHSFMAEYSTSNNVTFTGPLIQFDWVNPHSWAYVEVTGADGKKVIWKGETPPVNVLFRNGWTKPIMEKLVANKEKVRMRGYAAKDGSNHIFAQDMTILSTNTTMGLSGSPPQELVDAAK
jgi:hypothetical protein